jgi:competence protein ComEA
MKGKKIAHLVNLSMRSFTKAQQLVLVGISLFIVLASLPKPLDGPFCYFSNSKTQPRQQWVVEVTGAVRDPGIYTFSQSPTARQAIKQAGGIHGNPSFSDMTWSKTLQSGAHIEAKAFSQTSVKVFLSQMDVTKRLVLGIPVDLNQAGLDELAIVPGISRRLARRIIGFRESGNGFKTWHDLMGVRGVGPRNMQGFRDYLHLSEATPSNKQSPDHQ